VQSAGKAPAVEVRVIVLQAQTGLDHPMDEDPDAEADQQNRHKKTRVKEVKEAYVVQQKKRAQKNQPDCS